LLAAFPEASSPERTKGEPYRRALTSIAARLMATREAFVTARKNGEDPRFGEGYATSGELSTDLGVIARSLAANKRGHAGLAQVQGVMRQVDVFGFHLAKLDVRVPAAWVRAATEGGRVAPDAPGTRAARALATMRRRASTESGESFILSM